MPRTTPLSPALVAALPLPPRARATVARHGAWPAYGRVVLVDDGPAGLVVYPPADRRGRPAAPGTVELALVWVAPEHTGAGLGRVLVQAAAADLRRRGGFHAVDVTVAWTPSRPPAPRGFLTAVGFRVAHPSHPARLRLDLSTTLPDHLGWRREAEAALGRLRGVVVPSPAGRVSHDMTTAPPG